jgi:hypothetical protein
VTLRFLALLPVVLTAVPPASWTQNAPSRPEVAGVRHFETSPEEFRCGAAVPLRTPINVGTKVQKSKLRSSIQPFYVTGSEGLSGKIVLRLTINESGAVYSIVFLDCPSFLKQFARDAVCHWRYEPTYLHKKPVAVVTVVEVLYKGTR